MKQTARPPAILYPVADELKHGVRLMSLVERIHAAPIFTFEDVSKIFGLALEDIASDPCDTSSNGEPLVSITVLQCRIGYLAEALISPAKMYFSDK